MIIKELSIFTVHFIIGTAVVYLGMIVMRIIQEVGNTTMLQQLLVYVLLGAMIVTYLRIYISTKFQV